MAKRRPIFEVTPRKNVKAAIWENFTNDDQEFYTISLQRSYTDKNNTWVNETVSFSLEEVHRAVGALLDAERWIYRRLEELRKQRREVGDQGNNNGAHRTGVQDATDVPF